MIDLEPKWTKPDWVNQDPREYILREKSYPTLTEILQDLRFVDYDDMPESVREWAMKRGSDVHLGTQLIDEESIDWENVDSSILPQLRHYEQFKIDTGFQPLFIEESMIDKKRGFGTTIDRIGVMERLRGSPLAVVEIKGAVVMRWTGLQTAAQKLAARLPKKTKRYAVGLSRKGYDLHRYDDPTDETTFLMALHCFHWKKENRGK